MRGDQDEDRRQFTEYVTARRDVVRRAAYLMCGDWHWADDLTQTAFVRLAAGWERVRDRQAVDAYVRTCLVRAYLAETRRSWRRRERPTAQLPDVAGARRRRRGRHQAAAVRRGARPTPDPPAGHPGVPLLPGVGRGGDGGGAGLLNRHGQEPDRAGAGRAAPGPGRHGGSAGGVRDGDGSESMTGLREMFDELAAAPAPVGGLSADELYTAGRRRRGPAAGRGRRRGGGGPRGRLRRHDRCGGRAAARRPGTRWAPRRPGSPAPASAAPAAIIQQAAAADSQHLYLAFFGCEPLAPSCPKTRLRVVGSDDGGRTWSERGAVVEITDLMALDARTLVATNLGDAAHNLVISRDGGVTWSPVRAERTPATTMSAGAAVLCRAVPDAAGCTLQVVEPSGRSAPLTGAARADAGRRPRVPRRRHPVGGRHRRRVGPARGRRQHRPGSDLVHARVRRRRPAARAGGCAPPQVTSGDSRTAYAVVADPASGRDVVYRGTTTGGWQRLTTVTGVAWSFVASDGAHVLAQTVSDRNGDIDRVRFLAAAGGSAYRPVDLDGPARHRVSGAANAGRLVLHLRLRPAQRPLRLPRRPALGAVSR